MQIQLYKPARFGNRRGAMEMRMKLLAALGLALTVSGCSSVTNYSASHHVRAADGRYPVEIGWESNQRTVVPGSLRPVVQTGYSTSRFSEYPMSYSPGTTNRWTAWVPVPKGTNFFNYRVKVEFKYYAMPKPARDCVLSPPYQIQIIDP